MNLAKKSVLAALALVSFSSLALANPCDAPAARQAAEKGKAALVAMKLKVPAAHTRYGMSVGPCEAYSLETMLGLPHIALMQPDTCGVRIVVTSIEQARVLGDVVGNALSGDEISIGGDEKIRVCYVLGNRGVGPMADDSAE